MKTLSNLLMIGLLVTAGACAGESEPASSKVYVDVAKVAEQGAVEAVGGITAAGQPDEKAFKVFADKGYVAVIDMRGPDEDRGLENEAALVEDLGLEYVAFPITDSDEINFETARDLDGLLQGYDGPVLVHCASSNRVGALLALRESINGASYEEALAYGKGAGMTRLEEVVRERLGEK